MSGDLIERLHQLAQQTWPDTTATEAAEEIERLTEAVKIAQGNTDAAIEDYNLALARIAEMQAALLVAYSLGREDEARALEKK